MKASVKGWNLVLGGLALALLLAATGCRSVKQYRFVSSNLEAWYPLDENAPDPDSLSGLRVALQADWVSKSPYGPAVADRINDALLDALCGIIYGDSEPGEREMGASEALAEATSGMDLMAAMEAAEPEPEIVSSYGRQLADTILLQYPLGQMHTDGWMQALVDRYLTEYRQDLGGLVADIEAGRFSPNAAAYELECHQLLEVSEKNVLVWKTQLYLYTGGAHGSQVVHYLNVNPKTGAGITLSEVIKPEMMDTVRDRVRAKLAESAESRDIFDLAAVELPSQFRLGGDAILFQYQVYEIAPYVSGPIAVSLTKAELAGCLK